MRKKKYLIYCWIIPIFFLFLGTLSEVAHAASTVESVSNSDATICPTQRKAFYANGRYWVFYSYGGRMLFKTSTDGSTWGSSTIVRAAASGEHFSVWFDESNGYFHYAYSSQADNTAIYYRRGRPEADGSVTWSASEQTAKTGVSGYAYIHPNIAVDSAGRALIGYRYRPTAGRGEVYVIKNANTDGTWSTASGYPKQVSDIDLAYTNIVIVPTTNEKYVCVFSSYQNHLYLKAWTGSTFLTQLSTTGTVSTSFADWSAVAEGDDVHIVFYNNGANVAYTKYTYSSNSISPTNPEANIHSIVDSNLSPVLTRDTINNVLYCFWGNSTNNHIYYKRMISGMWDTNPTDWIDESTDALTGLDKLTAFHKAHSGKIGLVYMTRTSANYNVRFANSLATIPTALYRSVGATVTPLASGGSNGMVISGTTATFDSGLPNHIGVGDAIQYDSDNNGTIDAIAFIHGRTSSTVYTVKNKDGGTPTATTAKDNDWAIYRSYTTLANWESQFANANINATVRSLVNPSMNLVTADTIMNVACYGDGPDTTRVVIQGWTTGANNYIRIFTPVTSSEVGITQRHSGKWDDTKYRISFAPPTQGGVIEIREEFIRIEGLQVLVQTTTNTNTDGIGAYCNDIATTSDIRISNNIVRAGGSLGADAWGIGIWSPSAGGSSPTVRIWNNIIYDFTCSACAGIGVGYQSSPTAYTYNNTVSNCTYGYYADSGGTIVAKNNIAYSNTDNYMTNGGTFSAASTNNLSGPSQTDAPGSNARNAVTVTFVNPTGDPRDLHLASNDAGARNYGANLSSDPNLPFSNDIDGQSRYYGPAWDIGADEYANPSFEYRRSITVDRTRIRNPSTFPIGWDSVSSAKTIDPGAPTLTWSHTVGSGLDRILIVGVSIRNNSSQSVSSVSYNSIGLTRLGFRDNSTNVRVEMWYLKEADFPSAPGEYNIVVNLSAPAAFVAGAISLFNVDQTTPFGTFASDFGSGQETWAASVDIPSVQGEIVVATLAKQYNYAVKPEQMSHQADRWNRCTENDSSADILGAGTIIGGRASARAYWALVEGGSTWQEWAIAGVPVKPTTAAAPQIVSLTNYPLLVSLSDTTLMDTAHGGHVANPNGYDILFRAFDAATCGGTAPCTLDHEIEKYDAVNGQLVAWVRLPSVNGNGAASDTQIYMYYGNGGIWLPTENKAAVWDSNYMDVFHLAESSPNNAIDSKNGYVGTINNEANVTRTNAKINGGYRFGGNSYIVTNDATMSNNAPFTIESWFYIESGSPTWVGIATKNRDVSCTDDPPYCDWAGVWIGGSGELTYAWDWHNQGNIEGGPALSTGTWYYGAIVFDGGIRTGYRNGVRDTVVASPNPSPGVYANLVMPTRMNSDMPGGNMMTGIIDEVRISTIARTPGWILTTYENMNNPGNIGSPGFYTVGNEENFPPTAVRLTSFTAKAYDGGTLIQWRTGYEVSNLGFHVYREENGQLVRLTPEPVAGSALMAGSRTALGAGHHYHWWDTSLIAHHSLLSPIKYWLKDIDLNGTETMHGPVTPIISREPIPEKFRPELLTEIGWSLNERYRQYWRARELKEKLKTKSVSRYRLLGKTSNDSRITSNKATAQSSLLVTRDTRLRPQPSASDISTQRSLASRSAIKLLVKEEGWYRVSQPELIAAGLSPRVNPRNLQLYVEGKEQPIRVIGENDRRFDPGDAIEFYGTGLDTLWTDTRVYWLVEGTRAGKRIDTEGSNASIRNPQSAIGNSVGSFPYTIEKKERRTYFAALKNGDESNFFGPLVYPSVQVDQLLDVRHLDRGASGDALLEVALQGVTTASHRVRVMINEVEVGEVAFAGQSRGTLSLAIPQSLLEEGENVVTLIAEGGEADISLIEVIRLTYWHTYAADDNTLKLTAQGGQQLSIGGFGSSGIRVFDITDPGTLHEVLGKVELQKRSFAISFRAPGTGQRTLLVLTDDRTKSPEGIMANQPSSWQQVRDGFDLVMISHKDFLGDLDPLRRLRQSQGLKVALVNIEDLYDEFSFGNKSPNAIKDFLASAKSNWRRPPRFVLLVGDASFDPKNYLGYGEQDCVPTKLIDTVYLETASDDWFVDFNNDGIPEMAIGRLPVQTAEEVALVVSKIIGYDKTIQKREALLVADSNEQFNFERASEEMGALLPDYLRVRRIFRGQFSSDAQAKVELLKGINQGPLLVNFIGHGSVGIWRGNLLTAEDAENLVNAQHLPLFINMTCLNGFFQAPYAETLAEALLLASNGGAIGVWTSSGLTEPDKQAILNQEFLRLLFGQEPIALGEAAARAKASVSDQDVRRTWILFGDPATKIK